MCSNCSSGRKGSKVGEVVTETEAESATMRRLLGRWQCGRRLGRWRRPEEKFVALVYLKGLTHKLGSHPWPVYRICFGELQLKTKKLGTYP